MLQETRAKALSHQVDDRMATLRANMVQLQFLKDRSLDLALCMYSSIGMVRERKNRIDVMRQVSRALHPHGRFLVHVHNRGSWLRDPQGIRLTLHGWYQSLKGHWELGDRIYAYRGLPSMFLHIYSIANCVPIFARQSSKSSNGFRSIANRVNHSLCLIAFLIGGRWIHCDLPTANTIEVACHAQRVDRT